MSIKYLIMDVDGTLTDGKLHISNSGEIFKSFSVKDGCGIKDILPSIGIVPIILTGRKSEIVSQRCIELGIKYVFQGCDNKVDKLKEIASSFGSVALNGKYQEFAYVGDDIPDIEAMKMCGLSACPNDAVEEIKKISDYVCENKAGYGAVREFIEYLKSN